MNDVLEFYLAKLLEEEPPLREQKPPHFHGGSHLVVVSRKVDNQNLQVWRGRVPDWIKKRSNSPGP